MNTDTARAFAIAAHGDQRYGTRPYSYHLDQVADLLEPFGEQARGIGYLHDVVEDTEVSVEQIEAEFGALAARCVAILSDSPGATRQERKQKTYAKMAAVSGEAELALTVKAADRLANVQACVADNNQRLLKVYQGEQAAFKAAAYRSGQCDQLWEQLDQALATAA